MKPAAVRYAPRLDAEAIKAAIPPGDFYRFELPGMPAPRRMTGWTDAGLCCFHDDRRAGNFRVNLDTGGFVCFSCAAKGADIIAFTQRRYAVSFPDALRRLAELWEIG